MNKRRPHADAQPIDRALVDRTDGLVNRLGSGRLFHERTLAYASEAGVDNAIVFYAGGKVVAGNRLLQLGEWAAPV